MISLLFFIISLMLLAASTYAYFQSEYHTSVGVIREQPIPFSHKHHVNGLGLDCRFCHSAVEKSNTAGMPSTEVCMGCHKEIYRESPALAPLHKSMNEHVPIKWNRVHAMPDHVFFNHSIHIKKGVSCQSCHGNVELMPLVSKQQPMTMKWCLSCHMHPEKVGIDKHKDLTSCYTCHR